MKYGFIAVLLLVGGWAAHASHYQLTPEPVVPASQWSLLSLNYPEMIDEIYHQQGNQLIWQDKISREVLEQQLRLIDQAKISWLFTSRLDRLTRLSEQALWQQYDVLATDTLLTYISYAQLAPKQGNDWFFNGKLNHSLPLPSLSAKHQILAAAGTQAMADVILNYTPQELAYQQLVYAFRFMSALKDAPLQPYQQIAIARPGDRLADRETLIQRLALVNIDVSDIRRDVSWYDNSLVPAVKQFQAMHGLQPDGIIGPNTLQWLNLSLEQRLTILALNAERMRLWPSAQTSIVVNVPSFELHYWHAGQSVFQSKVVVGRTSRPTPVMTTRLDSLIVNPTWNIPYKIMIEDILPVAKKDVSYLTKRNIELLASWGANETLDPMDIDWSNISVQAFPYRMRQSAGEHNALGRYKFNTPNRRAIFLHDTPSKYLFERDSRAFSSGCIRVEHADRLASLLLAKQGLDDSQLRPQQSSVNQAIPLRQRIPVQIIYQTAWYEAGQLHFRDDIYQLDRL